MHHIAFFENDEGGGGGANVHEGDAAIALMFAQ